jgi:hypothetical protein
MAVLTITIVDQTFDKKSAEVGYLAKCLEIAAAEIQRGQGATTSGNVVGTNAAGTPNSHLGSWTYSASASNP